MIDDAFVREKLADLACYLQDLQQVAAHSLDEYTNNLFVKRTGERTIELISMMPFIALLLTMPGISTKFKSGYQLMNLMKTNHENFNYCR